MSRQPRASATVVESPANDVLRTGLAETYEDYAAQALRAEDRTAHGLWMTAASIARGYTPR